MTDSSPPALPAEVTADPSSQISQMTPNSTLMETALVASGGSSTAIVTNASMEQTKVTSTNQTMVTEDSSLSSSKPNSVDSSDKYDSSSETEHKTRARDNKALETACDLLCYVNKFNAIKQAHTGFIYPYDPNDLQDKDWATNHFYQTKPPEEEKKSDSKSHKTTSPTQVTPEMMELLNSIVVTEHADNKVSGDAMSRLKSVNGDECSSVSAGKLRDMAKGLGMKGYSKKNKGDLANGIVAKYDELMNTKKAAETTPTATDGAVAAAEGEAKDMDIDGDGEDTSSKDPSRVDEEEVDENHGVIATSYEIGSQFKTNNSFWMEITEPSSPGSPPVIDDVVKGEVNDFFKFIVEQNDSTRFDGIEDFEAKLACLHQKDLDHLPDGHVAKSFLSSTVRYNEYRQSISMERFYDKLYQYQSEASSRKSEVLVGFGHVRMVKSDKKSKDKNPEHKLVNGPLFEVPVDVKLQDNDGTRCITLAPKQDAPISLNIEILAALVGKFTNAGYVERLRKMADETPASSLRLDDPRTFHAFLEAAKMLRRSGEVRLANGDEDSLHCRPQSHNTPVIVDAYVLYSRKKVNSIHSRDVSEVLNALKRGDLAVSPPLRALVEDVEEEDNKPKGNVVCALPASSKQREVNERLFVDKKDIVIMEGPPGCGKTHQICNVMANALFEGMNGILASSNYFALEACTRMLEDRAPQLRSLVLDVSSVKENGVFEFTQHWNDFVQGLKQINLEDAESEIEEIESRLDELKDRLQKKLKQFEMDADAARRIRVDQNFQSAAELASELSCHWPWLVEAILCDPQQVDALWNYVDDQHELSRAISIKGNTAVLDDDAVLDLLKKKSAEEASECKSFEDWQQLKVGEADLDGISINGQAPRSQAEWKHILSVVEQRKTFRNTGCSPSDIYEIDGVTFQKDVGAWLAKGRQLCNVISSLGEGTRDYLKSLFDSAPSSEQQGKYRDWATEIQSKNAELIVQKVIAATCKKLDRRAWKTIKQMSSLLSNMDPGAMSETGKKGRHFAEFTELFTEAARFIPFMVLTLEQVSQFLPPLYSCDLGIVDEASQPQSTAPIPFMARCSQMLIVGDDKQVSPSTVGVSEDMVEELKRSLPDVSASKQLVPERSFLDLCQAACPEPQNHVKLYEHFRCVPEIARIFNEVFYAGELIPLQLPSNSKAIEDVYVKGGVREKKTNEAEAKEAATRILKEVERSVDSEQSYKTIGVISMSGVVQSKLIEKKVNEGLAPLIASFGPEKVHRHRLIYGTPRELQGNERDIIFMSWVQSPGKEGGKVAVDKDWQNSNVGFSRAKEKIVNLRSFDYKDLPQGAGDSRTKTFKLIVGGGGNQGSPSESQTARPPMFRGANLLGRMEDVLCSTLQDNGYYATRLQGKIWSNAFHVYSKTDATNNCAALLHVCNHGEKTIKWKKMFNEQSSLEWAGRKCLRVDFFSLLFRFNSTMDDVLAFLVKSGLPKPDKPSKKPRISEEDDAVSEQGINRTNSQMILI